MLDWLEVHELQEVVAGELPGRQSDEDIVVFKSNGLAAWDLAVAARVVELAAARSSRCAASAMSSPIALITSGRSSSRASSCSESAVVHVGVVEDVVERAAAVVLADHVRGDALLLRRARADEREEPAKEPADAAHRRDCILGAVAREAAGGRFAERVIDGVDDGGTPERIVIWIERKDGGVWAVGRAVNPQHRPSDEPRAGDYVFEGYELQDALDAANEALEDDVRVAEGDGRLRRQLPFRRSEILGPLERWFFGRR